MLLLKNGQILEQGILVDKDILIENDRILKIADSIENTEAKVLDLKGKFLLDLLMFMFIGENLVLNIRKRFTMHQELQHVVDLQLQCQCQT